MLCTILFDVPCRLHYCVLLIEIIKGEQKHSYKPFYICVLWTVLPFDRQIESYAPLIQYEIVFQINMIMNDLTRHQSNDVTGFTEACMCLKYSHSAHFSIALLQQ